LSHDRRSNRSGKARAASRLHGISDIWGGDADARIRRRFVAPERGWPEYLQKFIESEIVKWAGPIKALGMPGSEFSEIVMLRESGASSNYRNSMMNRRTTSRFLCLLDHPLSRMMTKESE
jgi:hypothetical protein